MGDLFLLRAQAAHLVETPFIGLVEVDGIADKELGKALVALATHGVLGGCLGLQVIGEPIGELAKGFLGLLHLGGVGVEAEGLEHRVGVGKPLALHNNLGDLAVWCHHAVGGCLFQGAAVAGQGGLHLGQAGANGIAVLVRVLRHEQQGIADGLDRGGDVIQAAHILAVVVQI